MFRNFLFILGLLSAAPLTFAQNNEPLSVGHPAPQFQLLGSDGKQYSLADFKGKRAVVIAWFPKAFTRG